MLISGGSKPSARRGGRRSGHPDPEIRRPGLKKIFSALRASVWSTNKRGTGPLPWIHHWLFCVGDVLEATVTSFPGNEVETNGLQNPLESRDPKRIGRAQ